MSIDELGFLSPDLEQTRQLLRKKYAEYFDLVETTVRLCHSIKYRLEVNNSNGQEIFAAGLFIKLMADAETCVLLLERGMVSQGRALLRITLECSINLANICASSDFLKTFILISEWERLRIIKGIKSSKNQEFVEFQKTLADKHIHEIKERLADEPEKTIRELAKNVGMEDLYNAQYRLYSPDVHSSPTSLERFFGYDENNEIRSLNWGPAIEDDPRLELVESIRILLTGLELVTRLFELDVAIEIQKLRIELEHLVGVLNTSASNL